MWCVCSVRFSSCGSVSGTLRGSLNSPSLFWLDEGEPGADCSMLSSCCSWKRKRTAVRSCLHDFCGWANKPRKHRSVFPFLLSQEESLGDYVAYVASVSVRFRSKAAERGTRNEERDFRVWFNFSRGLNQNLVPCRSSIFLCSETTRKSLLSRLETITG